MSYFTSIKAAIFDMDGLLVNSEPLWNQAEKEIFGKLGIDTSISNNFPDILGLRIDQIVKLWYSSIPWKGVSLKEIEQKISIRVIELIEEQRPLLPGVKYALELCQDSKLQIGLASASSKYIIEKVLNIFDIRKYFSVVVSAASLPYSKPHPEVYLKAANMLDVEPINCITFEDSFYGMIAVKAARMRSIVIPQKKQFTNPRWTLADFKLHSLLELTVNHII
ncbi:MAG: hexitol phosphatase HxpB [Arsenophonus endosymbiont of Ceratovacuna japonica]